MQSPHYLTLSSVLGVVLTIGGATAEAQAVRPAGPDRVTVNAEGIALGELLDQLAPLSPLESLKIDPAVRSLRLSLVAEGVSPLDAMWLALKASGIDFVMSDLRITAGHAAKAIESLKDTVPPASEPRLDAHTESPVAEPRPLQTDEHLLERVVVHVMPPSPPSVVERPGEMAPELPIPVAVAPLFDSRSQSTSKLFVGPPPDDFGRAVGARPVPFTIHEDSAVTQPGFVPYKLRLDVKNRRLSTNIGDIP